MEKSHKEIFENKQDKSKEVSDDIVKLSFLDDDYKVTRRCVCGFIYKEMHELKMHFNQSKICPRKICETDMKRTVMISDLDKLQNELLSEEKPNIDKTLAGLETLLNVVQNADFIYSSKYVIDINHINEHIGRSFILLMSKVDKNITDQSQKEKLDKCVAIWKKQFIDPNVEN